MNDKIDIRKSGFIPVPYETGEKPTCKIPVFKSEIKKANRDKADMEYFKKIIAESDFNKNLNKDIVCKKLQPENIIDGMQIKPQKSCSKLLSDFMHNFVRGAECMFSALHIKL